MIEFRHLIAIAYKGERVASRRLAARTGISEETALRATLETAAGADGLAHLLAERKAILAASAARAAARIADKAAANAARMTRHDGTPTPWRAWFDGSARPNPGRCGIGALLTGPRAERIEISEPAGYGNSSEAEYRALIAVLESALRAGARGLSIYGDSQVVINDVTGADAAAAPSLAGLRTQARALIGQLGGVALRWIPRHKNGEADALSRRAATASLASSAPNPGA